MQLLVTAPRSAAMFPVFLLEGHTLLLLGRESLAAVFVQTRESLRHEHIPSDFRTRSVCFIHCNWLKKRTEPYRAFFFYS